MRVVIVGATGNVGTALVRRLGVEPVDLVGVARRVPPDGALPVGEWHARDVARDDLVGVFRDADVVVHLAWAMPRSSGSSTDSSGSTRRCASSVCGPG